MLNRRAGLLPWREGLAIVGASCAVYHNSFLVPFLLDDIYHIVANPAAPKPMTVRTPPTSHGDADESGIRRLMNDAAAVYPTNFTAAK
jgi:hypothetical protein